MRQILPPILPPSVSKNLTTDTGRTRQHLCAQWWMEWPRFQSAERPFENADIASDVFYHKWYADRLFAFIPATALVQQWLKTLIEFPPRQHPESWSVGDVLEKPQQNAHALEAGSGDRKYDGPMPTPHGINLRAGLGAASRCRCPVTRSSK